MCINPKAIQGSSENPRSKPPIRPPYIVNEGTGKRYFGGEDRSEVPGFGGEQRASNGLLKIVLHELRAKSPWTLAKQVTHYQDSVVYCTVCCVCGMVMICGSRFRFFSMTGSKPKVPFGDGYHIVTALLQFFVKVFFGVHWGTCGLNKGNLCDEATAGGPFLFTNVHHSGADVVRRN